MIQYWMLSMLQGAAAQSPDPLPTIPEEDAEEAAPKDAVSTPPGPERPPDTTPQTVAPEPLQRNAAPPPAEPASSRTYELSLRSRYVSVPRGLLDLFLVNQGDAEWPLGGESRPDVFGYSLGLEFAVEQKPGTLLGFYLEYLGSLMQEGYWSDRDDPPDGRDGDYLRPSPGFGAVVAAFNAFHDIPIVDDTQTGNRFALSFYVGGGLGIVGIVGHVEQWKLDPLTGDPAYRQARAGEAPDGRLNFGSPIWPMIDFEMGFRMIFTEHVVLRLGGGLHGGLQLGGNLGARF